VPEVVAPLKTLHAPLGVVVVMGNHDHWFDEEGFKREIPHAGLALLSNQAAKIGPLVVGGVDDDYTGHANLPQTFAAMAAFKGPRILVTHSPDIVPSLPAPVAAVFAGHTHCGQILWPSGEPVAYSTRYGERFDCGSKNDRGQPVIISAGLGTSVIWLRYGAPPDVWLVTLGP
jgi:predicted MPP superfamily phosphohydrolase